MRHYRQADSDLPYNKQNSIGTLKVVQMEYNTLQSGEFSITGDFPTESGQPFPMNLV